MKKIDFNKGCISKSIEILANKWSALIIKDLFSGPKKFCELEKNIENINPRILTKKLVILENEEIIEKKCQNNISPRKTYYLTTKGQALKPIIEQMILWDKNSSYKDHT
jgi:DNA-binding HxlR family transcriptional regulator